MVTSETFDLRGISVHIGMPVAPKTGLSPKTAISLCSTVERLTKAQIDFSMAMEVSGIVTVCRDMVLDDFLQSNKQKLFWLDSDMVWTADDFMRLLALSTKHDCIACAYPAKVEGPETFYVNYDPANMGLNQYNLMPIKGVGLGFTIVDRKICEQLAAKAPRMGDQITGREMASVFRVDIHEGHRRTEDMAFFADIMDLGHTVWMDPTINLGHIGDRQWNGDVSAALGLKKAEAA